MSEAGRLGKGLEIVGRLLVRRTELRELLGEERYREEVTLAARAVQARAKQGDGNEMAAAKALAEAAPLGSTVAQLFLVAPLEIFQVPG